MARAAAQLKPVNLAELDPNDPYEGLTAKQQLFVTLSFSGLSNVEAYRQAYDCEGLAPGTIYDKAYLLAHEPLIKAKIKSLMAVRDSRATLAPWLTQNWILNGIANLAQHAEKEAVQLAAYVALGKTAGIDLFRETVRHEQVSRSVEDVETELKAKLDTMRASLTIEGSGRQVAADSGQPAAKDRRRKPKA
jgi:hypothetical protein